jgi:hypothetical protein
MNLALDWVYVTGEIPQPGRSEGTGFGQMVHLIFDWLQEPGAERALRRHWRHVERDDRAEKPD